MLSFEEAVLHLVKNHTIEEIHTTSPLVGVPHSLLYLPAKRLAFHLIPFPAQSVPTEQQLQGLSLEAIKQNIRLIHLFEDIWNTKNNIVSHRICALLGEFTRIHGRKTKVARISKPELDLFLNQNHLNGSPQVKYKYGLFDGSNMLAAASFSAGRPIERNRTTYRSYELVRFANLAGYTVAGGLGKLLSHFIAEVHPDDVMSYADLDWSAGISYQKLGFQQDGITAPQAFWIHPKEQVRYYPHKLPQSITDESLKSGFPIEDILTQKGYLRIFNAGNMRYLLLLK